MAKKKTEKVEEVVVDEVVEVVEKVEKKTTPKAEEKEIELHLFKGTELKAVYSRSRQGKNYQNLAQQVAFDNNYTIKNA